MRRTLTALLLLSATAVVTTAVPSDGQAADQEVVEVSGGAFGAFAEVRSDLLVPPSPPAIAAMVEAAAAEDGTAASAALGQAGIDPAAPAVAGPGEAVLAGVGPVPEVTLPAAGGGPFQDSLASIDLDGELIADFAQVDTEGRLGSDGFAAGAADLTDLDLLGLLGADLVSTTCLADTTTTLGSTELVAAGGIISGPFPDAPAPNTPAPFSLDTTFPIDPDGTTIAVEYRTILNEQVDDGIELTVNGMHTFLSLRLDPEGPGVGDPELVILEIELVVSQSRCGTVVDDVVVVDPVDPEGPVTATPTATG